MADDRLTQNLNRLIKHPAQARDRLAPVPSPGALPGRGSATPAAATGTGNGIASPLTEQPLKTIEIIKTIEITGGDAEIDLAQMTDATFLDAEGREVRFVFKPADRPLPVPPPAP